MTASAAGENRTPIYHGSTAAIVQAMQREILGTRKTMVFTPSYGHISIFTGTGPPRMRIVRYIPHCQWGARARAPFPSSFISVLRREVRTRLEEHGDAILVPIVGRQVQRGEPILGHSVRIRAQFEENCH